MFKILIIAVSIFLAVFGLSELLHRFWMVLLRPEKSMNILVTVLDECCAAEQVTAALEDMRWNGSKSACLLIGVDCGLSAEKADACRMIEQINEDFVFTTPERLWNEIKTRS